MRVCARACVSVTSVIRGGELSLKTTRDEGEEGHKTLFAIRMSLFVKYQLSVARRLHRKMPPLGGKCCFARVVNFMLVPNKRITPALHT